MKERIYGTIHKRQNDVTLYTVFASLANILPKSNGRPLPASLLKVRNSLKNAVEGGSEVVNSNNRLRDRDSDRGRRSKIAPEKIGRWATGTYLLGLSGWWPRPPRRGRWWRLGWWRREEASSWDAQEELLSHWLTCHLLWASPPFFCRQNIAISNKWSRIELEANIK